MNSQDYNRVVVVDVKMPFWSMVTFMVKWSIASIPAMIIIVLMGTIVFLVIGGLFNSIGRY